jgi:uncharacterized iron-regulated membrane protein
MSQLYRTIWRWHFYAGFFCIPFILVLSITGTIYLFKPQYESWVDADINHLSDVTNRKLPSEQVEKAMEAFNASFMGFELAPTENGANRIDVRNATGVQRVTLHPSSLAVLETFDPRFGLMNIVKKIHGELMIGNLGSYLVELAACWTIVLTLTGLYLWWPRNHPGLAGVLYPRLQFSGKIFWRDLHSVIGIWVSIGILLLVITGLPWASFWGEYFRWGRQQVGLVSKQQDWSTRSPSSHSEHGPPSARSWSAGDSKSERHYELLDLNTVVETALKLKLATPVMIQPPPTGSKDWIVKSNPQNRPKRETLMISGTSGEVVKRESFSDKHWLDQAVGFGIALHEGQLFGLVNQILASIVTSGLVALSMSGIVLWLRRRPQGVLGAPVKTARSSVPISVLVLGIVLCVAMPLFGASVILIILLESIALTRFQGISNWLGLTLKAKP